MIFLKIFVKEEDFFYLTCLGKSVLEKTICVCFEGICPIVIQVI